MLQAADVGTKQQSDIKNLVMSVRQSVEQALGHAVHVAAKMSRYILALIQHFSRCLSAKQCFRQTFSHGRL